MAYNKFTLKKVKKQFGLTFNSAEALFAQAKPIAVSSLLQETLTEFAPLAIAIDTEKARSEWIVAPILGELRKHLKGQMTLFSGINFEVDAKQDLTGFCDFLISRSPDQYVLGAPVITVVEAKKGDVMAGLGQAIATMVAVQIFDERENSPLEVIYGVSTTGTTWKFLKLIGQTVYIDSDEFYLRDLEKIMGILTAMVLN
jgi:hypothetical protein